MASKFLLSFRSARELRLEAEIPSFQLHLDSAIPTRQPGQGAKALRLPIDVLSCFSAIRACILFKLVGIPAM